MARIAIFDSGVGGLSIHAALINRLPESEFLFVSDNQAHPYGTKSDEFLIPRIGAVVKDIIDNHQPDVIVVACNTASTVALPSLRKAHATPIVGVVPAVKPAASRSSSKRIALLATPATISRPYTQQLINEFASDCEVLKVGSSKLVQVAEMKLRGDRPDPQILAAELAPIFQFDGCDTVVLACTHFPLLNNDLKSLFKVNSPNMSIALIDSGEAIARRVANLVEQLDLAENTERIASQSRTFMTRSVEGEAALFKMLQTRRIPYAGVL